MLLKAEGHDAAANAFARWRALIPFWNIEADRFRAAALAACRGGQAPAGIVEDIETVLDQVRAALQHCDDLIAIALPGDHQLTHLVNGAGEFEALLESLRRSLDLIEDRVGRPPNRRPAITIVRASLTAAVPRR